MFVPYDDELGVHPQAEGFTSHEVWDFAAHQRPTSTRCCCTFPYFDLYRKQVVKQADLVLAMQLRGDAFTDEQKARNFDYYERITVRDSSLSACTQAVIAAEVGHLGLAHDYLGEAALMDLDDLEHNTRDGLHIASLAGTWIALVARPRRDAAPRRRRPGLRAATAGGNHPARVQPLPSRPTAACRDHPRPHLLLPCRRCVRWTLTHHGQPARVVAGEPLDLPMPLIPVRPAPTQPAGTGASAPPRHRPEMIECASIGEGLKTSCTGKW